MPSTKLLSLAPASIAATVLALATCLTLPAHGADAPDSASDPTIARAATLLTDGDLVEAKRLLISLDRDALSAAERDRAFELMTAVDRRLRHADPVDVSLQKARLAIREGDLREADRQASAARRADSATPEQRAAAAKLLEQSAGAKGELAPLVSPAIDQAVADFDGARYAEAKAGFDSVYRSGAELTAAQLRTIDRYREKIAELEQARGKPFPYQQVSLAMLQPGQVTKRDNPADQPKESAPAAAPAKQPAPAPAEAKPAAQDAAPAEAAKPAPAAPPKGDDLISQALKFDAERTLAEADQAYKDGRYQEALDKYQQVAGAYRKYISDEDAKRAEDRAAEVRVLLQQAGGRLIEREIETRKIRAEQARTEFDNFLTEARSRLAAGDTEGARALASQARLRLSESRDLFSEADYNARLAQQEALLQEIRTAEETNRQREASQREERLKQEAAAQEARQQSEKRMKINEALNRVRALQMEQKYSEALQVVDQILFLDPQDPAGLLLKETLQDVIIYREWEQTQRSKLLSYSREFNRIEKSMIAPDNLLDYPSDWPEISVRRGEPSLFSETAADRHVLAELDQKRIPAAFTDNTLEDVIQFIATVTNLNVDVDWSSLQDIGISRDARVTLNLQPLPAKVVLDRVLEKVSPDNFSRAGWAVNDGVLVVASESALRKNTFIVIYDVRDLLFQIPSFTDYPQLDLDSVLNQRQGGGSGSIFQQANQNDQGERLTKEQLKDRLIEIIQTNVDFEGWRSNGGDTGNIQELNDNLIITNTAKNHRAISGLLRQLREIRSIQINVESRFLVVAQDFFEQIGFDIDLIFNAMNSQFKDADFLQRTYSQQVTQNAPSGNTSLLPSDLTFPQFSSPVSGDTSGSTTQIAQTNPPGSNPPEFGVVNVPYVVTRPDPLSTVPVLQNSNNIVQSLVNSPFAEQILSMNPAIAIAGRFLDDVQVDFLIEATQADRRNVQLTAPRLTFTNGHAANIYVTTQQSFVSALNAVVGTNSVAFNPTVSVVSSGFSLALDGVVSADRRYVTLTIRTALAQVIRFDDATVSAQTGGGSQTGQGSAPVTSSFQLPIVQVTSVSTGATIPDRGTLLIGGQRLKTEVEVESGVPVLSKIPVLNRFFSNRIQSKEEQTLLILIKPTILIQSEEEEKNFPGLLDSLQNRFNSGY